MPTYRRAHESDTWHFCRNCSKDPKSNYIQSYSKPTSEELCNECKAKQADNNCK